MTQTHDAETVGPRSKGDTCRGCPSLNAAECSEPSGDGETMDGGTENKCIASSGRLIDGVYGHPIPTTPEWCPHLPTQEVSVHDAAKVLLANCPNPIFDTLKPKLMGEFSQGYPFYNEEGDEEWADVNISWTVTKEIIASALRALSENPHD